MKNPILLLVKKILSHELISGSAYLFIGTTLGNIFAFIFNIFLVHHLSFANYAELTALTSLITLISIPAQAFLPTIVQFAGSYFARNEIDYASKLFWQATWKIGCIALIFFLGFIFFSPLLENFLHIQNGIKFLLVGAIVAVIYVSITNTAFLQSLLKFRFLALTVILGGMLKLFVGISAIVFRFGLYGILWGYFFSYCIPLLLTYLPLNFLLEKKKDVAIHNKEIFAYGLPAAIAVFSLSSFTSTDILLVKHFFPSSTAALYSGLSLIGRIIFYFSAPISSVMFPLVIKRINKGKNAKNLLYGSFLLVLTPSLVLTFFYFLIPQVIISLILGQKYLSVSPLLVWFGLYLCVFSLLNVFVNFLLSIRQTTVSWFIMAGAILQAVGICIFHSTIFVVVGLSLFLSIVLFIILLLYYQKIYVKTSAT